MKRFLSISLLLLSGIAQAQTTQAPNVSVTAASTDADTVAKGNSYDYGWDATCGCNRRIAVDGNGAPVPSTQSVQVNFGALTATASVFGKFAMAASTTATAQYLTVTGGSYVLICNPGTVDIVGDWSTSASTPTNLSNTGAVRVQPGNCLSQSVKGNSMIIGYPWFIYSNQNATTPSQQSNY